MPRLTTARVTTARVTTATVLVATAAAVSLATAGAPTAGAAQRSQDQAATSTAVAPGGSLGAAVPPLPSGWRPGIVEDFDRIDSSRWNVRNQTSNANEHSYLLARNVTTKAGVLRIQGRKERAGGRAYTSGYVDTNRKYALPNYFRAEIRAKVPFEQGMWAAPLWFRPSDHSGGEIDLIETYGRTRDNPRIHQTIHTDYGLNHEKSAKPSQFSEVGDATGTRWHVYTVEKRAGSITMWVDGVQTARWSQGDPSWFNEYYEAGKQWNLRVNLQIGGSWGGLPDSTTNWRPNRSAMRVDYIKTWIP